MTKRMVAFVLVSAMTLTMAACGSPAKTTPTASPATPPDTASPATPATPAAPPQAVTLKLSFNGDFISMPEAILKATERVNERYAKEGKNIVVTIEEDRQTIDNNEYHNNIVFAHKSGDAPDMFISDPNIPDYVKAGCMLDISDIILNNPAFAKGVEIPTLVDGKAYALPFDLPMRVIYYNHKDLAKIGWTQEQIDALPKKIVSGEFTLEQFIELCGEVVQKGGAQYGLVHRPGAGNDFFDILNALGGEYFDAAGNLVFDEPALLRFLQFTYDNANTTKITPNNLNQMGWDTINKMVGTGDAFAYYGPMFSATYVAKAAGLSTEEFAANETFVPFPKSANSKAPFTVAAPQFMAISAATKHPDICKDIYKELTVGSVDMMARHGSATFNLSSIKAANELADITSNPILKNVIYMQDYAKFVPAISGQSTLKSELFTQIVSLELGQIKPAEAMEKLKAQIKLNVDNVTFK